MKTVLLAFSLLVAANGSSIAQAPVQDSTRDQKVIVAVLTHLRVRPRYDYPADTRPKNVVLLNEQYEGATGMLSAGQLQTDLTGEDWRVPEAARLDLVRRTEAKTAFPTEKFPVWVQLVPPASNSHKALASAATKQSGAKYHVSLWPPGYSADGKKALMHFSFSPGSPHGSDAWYWLEFRQDQWQVVHRLVLERV